MDNKLVNEYIQVIQETKEEHLNEFIFSLIKVSRNVYKRYMSQAAKACRGLSFKQRTKCMLLYRIEALKQEISSLKNSSPKCEQARRVSLCKARIDKKVLEKQHQLKKDISKLDKIKKQENKKLYEYEHPLQTRPKPKTSFTGEKPDLTNLDGRGPSGLQIDLDDDEEEKL